jgi:hypothetical protein
MASSAGMPNLASVLAKEEAKRKAEEERQKLIKK